MFLIQFLLIITKTKTIKNKLFSIKNK